MVVNGRLIDYIKTCKTDCVDSYIINMFFVFIDVNYTLFYISK